MRFGGTTKSVWGKALVATFALLMALPSELRANDWNLDRYTLTLNPTDETPIRLYDMQSNFLGELSAESSIPLTVTGEMVRRAIVNGSPDMRLVLRQAAYQDANGNFAMLLTTNQVMRTREGRALPAGMQIMVALNDFLAITPGAQREPEVQLGARFSTQESVPDSEYDPLDGVVEYGEDDDEEFEETQVEKLDIPINRLSGRPFPARWLSQPICNGSGAASYGSDYGPRRRVRTKNGRLSSGFHKGLDVRASTGTPVVAAADGCVSRRVGTHGGYGKTIFIGHGNGYETQYSHLSRFAPGIREGACFSRGETIGFVGETGNSTGPHLHWSVLRNNSRINPDPMILGGSRTNAALRQRCDRQTEHPVTDQAMRNSLGIGGGGGSSYAGSTRGGSSSN